MAKTREPVDDVLDAIVWMRRKSKKHEAVDDFIDALLSMRRNTKKQTKKSANRKPHGSKGLKAAKRSKLVKRSKAVQRSKALKRSREPQLKVKGPRARGPL